MELEERRRQETSLARELEEANLMIEEQYASMAEEVSETHETCDLMPTFTPSFHFTRTVHHDFDVWCIISWTQLTGVHIPLSWLRFFGRCFAIASSVRTCIQLI